MPWFIPRRLNFYLLQISEMIVVDFENIPVVNLSGNFPEVIEVLAGYQKIEIKKNGQLVLQEVYQHSGEGRIQYRLKELFDSLLTTMIPYQDVFEQTNSVADFSIQVLEGSGSPLIYTFRVVKGGVDNDDLDSENFLKANFLTWKPQVKKVKYLDPQWLSYYAASDVKLMKQASYYENDVFMVTDPVEVYALPAGKKYTCNVKFEKLWGEYVNPESQPVAMDCWIEDAAGTKLTYVQRYVLTDEYHEFDDLFLFENSVGGVDVIRFTGETEKEVKHEFKNALFGENTREFDITLNRPVLKNTGYFHNAYELLWTNDFLTSLNRNHYVNGLPLQISLKEYEAKSKKTVISSYSFSFVYSKQNKYLNNNLLAAEMQGMMNEFNGMPVVWNDIYVRIFGDQTVDGSKTFLQPIRANSVIPASGGNLNLNSLVVLDGGIIDCGEF